MFKDKRVMFHYKFTFSELHFPISSLLIGEQEIDSIHSQTNATEPDNPRTWSATAVVQVTAMRERHGDILRCLSFHESYTAKSVPVEARLDIKCELMTIPIHYPKSDTLTFRDGNFPSTLHTIFQINF